MNAIYMYYGQDEPLLLGHASRENNPFFYCLNQILVHALVGETPFGGSKDVGWSTQMLYTFVLCSIDVLWTRRTT
jgi:hypothetical protein